MTIHRLTEKLHISWLVAMWCLGLMVGVIAVYYLQRAVTPQRNIDLDG